MKNSGRQPIILGLGNPGPEYEFTYHNAGVLAVRYLVRTLGQELDPHWQPYKKTFSCVDRFVIPLIFMNESGVVAKEALKKFDATPEDLIVIHDDSDLAIGEYKISRGQSSAGHKGVQSIIDHLGTNEFQRIRIGIRGEGKRKAGDFVLNRISERDEILLQQVFEKITDSLASLETSS